MNHCHRILLGTLLVAAWSLVAAQPLVQPSSATNLQLKASHSIGIIMGSGFARDGMQIDLDLLRIGIEDALRSTNTLDLEMRARDVVGDYRKNLDRQREQRRRELAANNRKDGEKFLEQNSDKPGIRTLASGLQYRELVAGSGKRPSANDSVTVNLGLSDLERKTLEPTKLGVSFPVGSAAKGIAEALLLMKEGCKWELFMPAKLAYGDNGRPGIVEPGMAVRFEIELLSTKPPSSSPPPASGEPGGK